MREIIHHLLGSCGETHLSILSIISSGIVYIYRDYIICIAREVRDAIFKWGSST